MTKQIRYIATNKGDVDKVVNINRSLPTIRQCIGTIVFMLIVAVIVITACLSDIAFLLTKRHYPYENILAELPKKNINAKKLVHYVNYIVDKVKIRGPQAIQDKWAADVCGAYKTHAAGKLAILGSEGFKILKVCYDNKTTYSVKCLVNIPEKDIVFFDITKEILPNGDHVFRLLRIY